MQMKRTEYKRQNPIWEITERSPKKHRNRQSQNRGPRKANKETDRKKTKKKTEYPDGSGEMVYLGVKHDSTENTGVFHGGFEIVEGFLVVVVRSMRKVEASDVHACSEKLF